MGKDLEAKFTRESITQMKKRDGIMVEEVVEKPSAEMTIEDLMEGVVEGGPLTGFANFKPDSKTVQKPQQRRAGVSGFGAWADMQEPNIDDNAISSALKKAKVNADTHYDSEILRLASVIEQKHRNELPDGWEGVDEIREVISSAVAEELELPFDKVDEIIKQR